MTHTRGTSRVILLSGLLAWALTASAASAAPEVDPAVFAAESARIAIIEKIKDSVLAIFAGGGDGGGSGVLISADGYGLTNFHVAQPSGAAMKCGTADGRLYDAVIVGIDPTGDVALIKLLGRDDFPHAELGDSDTVAPGDPALVLGNPFLLATDFQPTVTYGIISGVHRYQYPAGTLLEYTDCIQTDASINPGNSGGPFFNASGQLIGINGRGSFEKRGRVNVGVGYAISINQIKNFLGGLRSGRVVDHATLGARVGFDEDNRVVVVDLLEESDAYRRGLRYDDEIISFAGRPITTPNGFKNVLGTLPKGWRVPLSFRRGAERHDVLVRLTGVHSTSELLEKIENEPVTPPGPPPDRERPKEKKPSDEDAPEDKSPPDGAEPSLPVLPVAGKSRPLPEAVRAQFEARHGYANYHFNKLERDRVWQAYTARGSFAPGGIWTLSGPLEQGGRLTLTVADDEARLKLPTEEIVWSAVDDPGSSLVPEGSGGLLAALWLWRQLAVEGPEKFGEVHYAGTAPLPDHAGLVDVLTGIAGGVECLFYFDEGRLLALEMFPEQNVDPCALTFADFREVNGREVPGRIDVRYGDERFAVLTFDKILTE